MLTIRQLIWDAWNIEHISRHNVTPEEVDEICMAEPLVQQGSNDRLAVSGKTNAGRFLVIILDPESKPGVYYVVTAFPASGKYRKIFDREKGKEKG